MSDGVIGSVSVRVKPDTSNFSKEAKTELDAWEARQKPLRVEIEADFDPRDLTEKVKAAVKDAQTQAKSISLDVDLGDTASVKAALAKVKEQLKAIAADPVKIRVTEEGSNTAAFTALRNQIRKAGQVSIETDLSEASLLATEAELAAAVKAMERANTIKLRVEANSEKTLESLANGLARISGLRLIGGIFDDFRSFFLNVDKSIPLISGLTLAILGLGGGAAGAAGSIFSLSRALAQIGPGALALPGMFAGIVIGLGATIAVFKDFNKHFSNFAISLKKGANGTKNIGSAWSQLQNQMSNNFWDRFEKPMGNLLNTVFPKFSAGLLGTSKVLGTFFSGLANGLTNELGGNAIGNMFADLNKSIANMATHTGAIASLFRILGEAGAGRLPELANWLGKVIEKFNSFMSAAEKSGDLNRWIDTSVQRIKELGNVLLNAGSFFKGLATAADNADGKSGNALSNLADSLGRAASAVNSSGFQAALTGVLRAAHQEMDNISQGAGPAFTKFWTTFSQTLQTVLPQVGKAIGTLLGAILNMLASPEVQSGLTKMVDGITQGISKLAPAFDVLAPKMGAFMTLIGQMANTFGGVLATAIQTVAPLATALATALTPLVAKIGPLVQKVFADLAPVVQTLAGVIAKLGPQLAPLIAALTNLWNVVGPLLVPVLQVVISLLGTALIGVIQGVTLAINGIANVISGVVSVFQGAWELIVGIFTLNGTKIIDGVKTIFGGLGGILKGIFQAVVGIVWASLNGDLLGIFRGGITGILSFWKGGFSKLGGAVKEAFGAVKGFISDGWAYIKGAFSGGVGSIGSILGRIGEVIVHPFTAAFSAARGLVSAAWAGIKGLFEGGVSGVVAKVKQLPGKVLSALGNLGTFLLKSGEALLDGFKQGIENGFSKVTGAVKSGLSKIRGFFPFSPAKEGPFSGKGYTTYSGRALMKDFGKGIEDGATSAVKSAAKAMGAVGNKIAQLAANAVTNMNKKLAKAASEATAETIRETQAAVNKAISAAEDAAKKAGKAKNKDGVKAAAAQIAKIKKAWSDAQNAVADAKDWRSLGKDISTFIGLGLDNNLSRIKSKITTLLNDIPMGVSKATAGAVQKAANNLQTTVGALADVNKAIADQIKQIQDAATQFAQSAVQALTDLGNPSSLGASNLQDTAVTLDQITTNYQAAIDRAKAYSDTINDLRKLKLDPTVLQQLIDAGPDAGYQAAKAIDSAGQAGVDNINTLATQLATASQGIKDTAYQTALTNGMKAAQGILDGYYAQKKQLTQTMQQQMTELGTIMGTALQEAINAAMAAAAKQAGANVGKDAGKKAGKNTSDGFAKGVSNTDKTVKSVGALVSSAISTVKDKLDIHSPSRVFRELGGYTAAGFALGISDGHDAADKAIKRLVVTRPSGLDTAAYAAAAGSTSSTSKTINYYAAPGTPSLSGEEALFSALTRARSNGF